MSQPMFLGRVPPGSGNLLHSPAAVAAAVCLQPRGIAGKQCKQRHVLFSAAAADAALSTANPLDGIVPYNNHRSSQLKGRSLPSNPLQGLWDTAAKTALRAELTLAAAVDKQQFAPYVMAGLAGVLVGAGLDASTLLRHGLPPYMPDLLLHAFGAWDTTLWAAALTAAALPATVWALRAWWRANMLLLGNAAGALQAMQQQQQQDGEGSTAAAIQQPQQQQQQQGSIEHLVAAAVAVFRGLCLSTAASSLIGLLYTRGASSTASAITAATGAGAIAAAVASLVLLQQHGSKTSSSSSTSSRRQALLPLLAAEAAWLAAAAGLGPLVSTAAAVVLGGSLYLLHSTAVAPALLQYKAAAGDVVEVHVGLKLAGTQPVFDSTLSEEPIRVQVSRVPAGVLELWEEASADPASAMQAQGQDPSSSGGGSGGGSSSSSEEPLVSKNLSEVQHDIQRWMKQPMARWDALKPFVAAASEGLYLGETVSVPLYNPKVVGYWSPHFTWWQPIAEVQQKFKGNMPGVGDVFWYPVADGAAVPTRVNAIGQDYVELDANYGVTGTELELQVQLVRLQKPAQQS